MYYDLICSLPRLPHFEEAEWLPITPLRMQQRLRRLQPEHAAQLNRCIPLVRWQGPSAIETGDVQWIADYTRLMETGLAAPLRQYVNDRITQQTLLAALRYRRDGMEFPANIPLGTAGLPLHSIRNHWDALCFGLEHRYRWLPMAAETLSAGDAIGLERLLIDLNWQWLTRRAEKSMFDFAAVVAYVFKWDMLQAWLAFDPLRAKARFTALIDKVTHVANE